MTAREPASRTPHSMLRGSIRENEPLWRHTTLRVGGPARFFVAPSDTEELLADLARLREWRLPWRVIGLGSNLLVPDEGFDGAVLQLGRAANWVRYEGARVEVGAGYPLARLVQETAKRGLAGTLGLAGIPGNVGGAIAMNAGTPRGEIGDVIESVRFVTGDGELAEAPPGELGYGYRTTHLQDYARGMVAISATLRLREAPAEPLLRELRDYMDKRNGAQPVEWPNTGSVWTNPQGTHAGRLIEEAGLKGERRGDAQISPKHANFIVNLGAAKMRDVLDLMILTRDRVHEESGIRLHPEVRWLDGQEVLERLLAAPPSS